MSIHSTDWRLDNAVIGSPILVRRASYEVPTIKTVAKVSSTRVTLDDGTVWSRLGNRVGHGNSYGSPSARLILNMETVKRDIEQEAAQRKLDHSRTNLRRRVNAEARQLDQLNIDAIIVILDLAKAPP